MKFDWQTVSKIVLALVASGFVWTQDNQLALLSLIAIAVVWVIRLIAQKTGKTVNKFHLSIVLLVVSIGCALLFQGFVMVPFPGFEGDLILFVSALFTWLGALLTSGAELFAVATALYNILLSDVLKQLEPSPAAKAQ